MEWQQWAIIVGAFLVVGFSFYFRHKQEKGGPGAAELQDREDPRKLWAQAAMALYQGDVGDAGYWSGPKARDKLKGWSTTTQGELIELINRYIAGECNVGFDKLRIVWLARLGKGAQWFDDATSWRYAFDAIAELQRHYGSWPELYEAMKAGRVQWYGGPDKVPSGTQALNESGYAFASKKFFPKAAYR